MTVNDISEERKDEIIDELLSAYIESVQSKEELLMILSEEELEAYGYSLKDAGFN